MTDMWHWLRGQTTVKAGKGLNDLDIFMGLNPMKQAELFTQVLVLMGN